MKVIEVCDECTQNCVLIHGQKKDPSPVVISFLKLLYGNYDFSKFLYLPPEVSRKMSALIDQQNYDLEDSNGQRWTVTLANINNVLALDKGWHKFFTDHGLREGDTLIFNYIIGSHFVVQIYGKTGCQKLNFPKANGNQRTGSKTKGKFRAETGECHMNFNDLRNKQGSGILNENPLSEVAGCEPPVEVAVFGKVQKNNTTSLREKVLTIDKDHQIGHPSGLLLGKSVAKNEKNRNNSATTSKIVKCLEAAYRNKRSSETMKSCKKDLMEMNKMSSSKSMNSGKDPNFFNELGQSSSSAEKGETMKSCKKELMEMNKMSSCKSMNSGKDPKFFNELGQSSSRAEKGETMKSCKKDLMEMNKMSSCKSMNSGKDPKFFNELGQSSSRAEKGETMKSCKKDLLEMNKMSSCKSMNSGKDPKFFNELGQSSSRAEKGETMKSCKKELMEMNKMSSCKSMNSGKDPKFFNELGQSSSKAEKDNNEVFKVVKTEPVYSFNAFSPDTSNNSCLAVVGSQAQLELAEGLPSVSFRRASKKVVILRGPNTIFWPVLYQEKYGLKALASGWKAFCMSNSLRPGDECVFRLENGTESIYSVNIVRK